MICNGFPHFYGKKRAETFLPLRTSGRATVQRTAPAGTPGKEKGTRCFGCLKIGCGNYLSSRRVILKYFRRKRA